MKDDKVYLSHILGAIEQIEIYLSGTDYDSLKADNMLLDAVARELEIIGEAANNISEEFRKAHKNVPWHKAIGLRNKIIHEYFGLDLKILWETCRKDLPKFKKQVEDVL